ncbi:type II secretion system protein [Cryobacterium glaciale]|uniref:Type II secretion system protein n=1 Tax=Cryobacterium glaciale TaxID=1259145 RepID=A0A4R8UYX3_9MICO|nr:type II secretion system protein [Cryobacterium glaciale]TFB73668.1 type II secretion system protein [Cryobacterium glaciale]
MHTLLRHLGRRIARNATGNNSNDAGISLIEVLIAMLIFAVIAVGVGYGIVTSLYLSNDARSREAATNLAAQEIDLARSAGDVFSVLDRTTTVVQNGTTFSVHRSTDWETTTGADGNCGSGGGQLRYRRVNVSVTWDSMRATTPVVRADSALAPGSRINDPGLGTILVSVLTASGSGAAGVAISAVPGVVPNAAATLTETPTATDAQGCSYLLKVKPGTYDVSASRPNFVDKNQASSSTMTVGVAAGGAASVAFAYDLAGTITASYGTNVTSGTTLLPNDLHTTWRSTYAAYTPLNASTATTQAVRLHPFASGYQVFAGSYVAPTPTTNGCVAVDPAAWTTPAPDGAIGTAAAQVATLPGGGASVDVPLGVLTVSGLAGQYLLAVSQPAGVAAGDPGCALETTFSFGPLPAGPSAQLGLPFGSFALFSGASSATTIAPVPAANLVLLTRGSIAGSVVTLDPRLVVAP